MTTTLTAVTLLTLAIYCHSTPLPATTPETSGPDYSPDSYLGYQPVLPLGLQLPREDNPGPFYAAEPPLYLSAPREDQEPNYYQVPIPAQDLEAPTETQWNPSNNPKFYYEVPALLSKQELPTEQHPKKYNEEVHSKKKPYSSKPKQELVLEPIDKNRYDTKQRALEKTFEKLAKKQNQKEVEAIKARQDV